MADLVELDYDPYATPSAETKAPTAEEANQTETLTVPTVTVPPASKYKLPKVVVEGEKPKGDLVELDFDPYAKPEEPKGPGGSMPAEIGKGVAAGAVSTTGGMLEGAGAYRQEDILRRKQEEARAAKLKELGLTGTTDLRFLPKERQEEIRKALQEATESAGALSFTDDPFYKAGLATSKWSDETFKAAHDYEDSWTRKFSEGFGSIMPFVAAGLTPGVGPVAGLVAGEFSSIGEGVDKAVKEGATPQQLQQVIQYAAIPGLTEQASVEALLTKIPLPVAGKVMNAIFQVAAKMAAEGGQEAVQQAMQNIIAKYVYKPDQDLMEGVLESAIVGGVVGGGVGAVSPETYHGKNEGEEKPAKVDDTPDTAAPVQPEGTPAPVTPSGGVSTPGNTGATEPPPPEGVEKQPESPGPATIVPGTDVRTPAKPPVPNPAAAAQPTVTVVTGGQTAPDVAAALGGTPTEGEFNVEEETAPGEDVEAVRSQQADILRQMFRDQQVASQEEQKATARRASTAIADVVTGADPAVTAALNKQATTPRPETLGTGIALTRPNVPPVAPTPSPQVATAPSTPDEALRARLTPEENAKLDALRAPSEDVAAFTPEPAAGPRDLPTSQALEPAVAAEPLAADVQEAPTPAPPSSLVEPAVTPEAVEAAPSGLVELAPDEVTTEEPLPPKAKQAVEVETRKKRALQKPTEAPGRPAAVEAAAAPAEAPKAPVKAAAAVAKSKAKEAPKTEVVKSKTELQQMQEEAAREDAARKAEREKAEAERPRIAKDIHRQAKDELRQRMTDVAEGDLETMVREETDRYVAESPKDASPSQKLREGVEKVIDRVHERQAAREAEEQAKFRSEEERLADERVAKKEAELKEKARKQAEQAAAEKAQQKERAGKEKGKSATGIVAESEASTKRAAEKAPGDPLLARWLQLYNERSKLRGEEARAPLTAEMQEVQAQRARAAEEKALSPEEEAKRAKDVEKAVKPAVDAMPSITTVPMTGNKRSQIAAIQQYLLRFGSRVADALAANGQQLAKRINTVHNSPAENLAIYARKIINNLALKEGKPADRADYDNASHGVVEFAMAMRFYESGDIGLLNDLIRNEKLKGSGEKVEQHAGPAQDDDIQAMSRPRDPNAAFDEMFKTGDDHHAIEVTTPKGKKVNIRARTLSGKQALREVQRIAGEGDGGFVSILRNLLIKNLSRLVGDIDVHIVSPAAMDRLKGEGIEGTPQGLYYNYTDAQRAAGMRPMVFINAEEELFSQSYVHTMLHELTHAATSQAIRDNVRGSNSIFTRIRNEMRKQLVAERGEAWIKANGFEHAFTTEAEFVAEAFSNEDFQQLLAETPLPTRLQISLASLTRGRVATWWDAATAAISNAIGMITGKRGASYMDGVVKLFPEVARSSEEQELSAIEKTIFGKPQKPLYPRATPDSLFDTEQLEAETQARVGALRDSVRDWMPAGKRRFRDMVSSSGELDRRAVALTKDAHNGLSRMLRILQRKDPLKAKYRALGNKVQVELQNMKGANKKAYAALSHFLHESSRYGLDARVALSDKANAHIEKTGNRHANARAEHARLHAAWNALPADVKATADRLVAHYEQMHALETKAHITHAVKSAMAKYRATLPPGETMDSIVNWVSSGEAARDVSTRTQRDKDLHKALGKTAETLAGIPALRKLKGLYVPLTRRGRHYFSGLVKVQTPTGAVADPSAPDGNRFFFANEKDLQNFANTTDLKTRVHTMHIDPKTGQKVPHDFQVADPSVPGGIRTAKKVYIATVQNKFLEMHDSVRELELRQKQLQSEGHQVHQIRVTDDLLGSGANEISTPEIRRLIANLEQTTVGNMTLGQEMAKNAILDAQIRMMADPGHLQRRLKRKGVMGYDIDLAGAQRDYDSSVSSHIANLELAPEMAEASAEFNKYRRDQSRNNYGTGVNVRTLDQLANEVGARIKSPYYNDNNGTGTRIVNFLLNTAYLRHLASPHFTIMQMVQPFMTTYPVLASRFGEGAAWRETMKAYRLGGVKRTLGRGFKETWRAGGAALRGKQYVSPEEMEGYGTPDKEWIHLTANEPDAAQLHDLFGDIRDRGYGASSGLDVAALDDTDLTRAEKIVHRLSTVAKGMPESAEGINRYATAIAAYRLAVRDGMSHADAKEYAVSTVEQTQGGYARANNPVFFQNPLLRFPLQFRKYGVMYGQMYYGSLIRSFKGDPETKKIARKQLLRLSLTTAAMAGIGGLPMMEIARILFDVAAMMGWSDDDWDETEKNMQRALRDITAALGAGKDFAAAVGEIGLHGLTRLAQVDTSSTFGADNLVTFGSPKTMDEKGVDSWILNMLIGAGGSMVKDTLKNVANGNYWDAVPWPKVFQNLDKAYELYTEGTVDKKTGERYAKPVTALEAGWQALGFKPRSSAQQWEAGGSGTASKKLKEQSRARSDIMGRWANAKGSAQSRIFNEEVAQWNRTHTGRERIEYRDLLASKKTRERRRKEREEAAKED